MNNIFISNTISNLESYIPKNKKIFVIIDNNLKLYYNLFSKYDIIEIETSEKFKTLNTVEYIINKLLEKNADRNCFLLGVGGGIITDITGFTGSIYKRGVPFGFIPTTLLSQCDASIGGKNGVNFNFFKNIIGTITQPEFVIISPEFLKTLPEREIKNGAAEIIKTFILFDPEYYKKAINFFSSYNAKIKNSSSKNDALFDIDELTDIISKCTRYKKKIVEEDANENGIRRLLNLGHTFAHAIEKIVTQDSLHQSVPKATKNGISGADSVALTQSNNISHGEAVSIGIIYAAKIAEILNVAISDLSFILEKDLVSMGLPTKISCINVSAKEIADTIMNDKKVNGTFIHYILPCKIGEAIDKEIELNKLEEIISDLR